MLVTTLAVSVLSLVVSVASLIVCAVNNKRMFGRYFPPGAARTKR